MNKTHSLILTLIIIFIAFIINSNFKTETQKEEVIVKRIIDGDTLVLADNRTLRFLNINAPEKDLPSSLLTTNYLKKLEGKNISIESKGEDKYGRTLARIYSPEYLNLDLVKRGLASKFLVDNSELKEFFKAEESAINLEKGMWKKSIYFYCTEVKIDQELESVSINLSCDNTSLKGWTIKDESRKIYTFQNNFSSVILNSKIGKDSNNILFWNSKTDIWNDDRDTVYVFDILGNIASHYSYGYS